MNSCYYWHDSAQSAVAPNTVVYLIFLVKQTFDCCRSRPHKRSVEEVNVDSYPTSGNWKRASCVEASLSIINWKTVTKDSHLEMLNHGVHHLSTDTRRKQITTINICLQAETISRRFFGENLIKNKSLLLPVDPARTFIWFDVHLIQVDIDFRDVHLEAVRKKLDGFPNIAIARSPWQRK